MEVGCQGYGSERHHPFPNVDDPSKEDVRERGEADGVHRSGWIGCNPQYGLSGCRFLTFTPPAERSVREAQIETFDPSRIRRGKSLKAFEGSGGRGVRRPVREGVRPLAE